MTSEILITKIKSQFTDNNARKFFDPYWVKRRLEMGISSIGFCYLSSHAFYQLIDDQQNYRIRKWINATDGLGHFWIETIDGSKIIDLTPDQYPDGFPHYKEGVPVKINRSKKVLEFVELVRNSS